MTNFDDDPFNLISNEQTADVMYLRYHLGMDHGDVARELGLSEEGARTIALQGLKRTRQLVYGK